MAEIVRVVGAERIAHALSGENIGPAFGAALREAGLRVQVRAQHRVHSPDNPYIGKARKNIATGRLQASIGTSDLRGSGLGQSVAVGTPYGETGFRGGTFSRSRDSGKRNARGQRIQPKRTGDRKNKGDPQEYGIYEERKHPFLVPALEESLGEIESLISDALEEALRR